ncbi:Fe(3+) dicitrate ABC transporter substrate-binding protein [Gracilibacillus sp. YIM 98692]|uniref:ABC transporter substrate-binding protein n=1 Tax=Gracilibacillus sp. YIM 98692 TaxID=2663532 RepID=UPI001F0A036C|nr:Fe(3+) dicitrate ABC transporter substrate-binding protein [Gracilibacillus sp. YIM 98692]
MKKIYFMLLLSLLFVLAACGAEETNPESDEEQQEQTEADAEGETEEQEGQSQERVISHEMGETPITGTPENIVVLEFSYVDALAALDISPVGIADDNDSERIIEPISEKIDDYTSVGTRKQPSLEVISSLQPDLIIADLQRHKEIYDQLNDIAPTIVLASLSADYQGILDGFEVIAEAVGKEEKGAEVMQAHDEKMEELRAQVPEDEERTVLPAVVASSGFFAHDDNSYTGSLLASIGLDNAIKSGDERYNKINLEQVVEFNPDVMFHMVAGDETVVDEWEENDLYQGISAVESDQVYEVNRNMWSRFRGLISSEQILEDAIEHLYGE